MKGIVIILFLTSVLVDARGPEIFGYFEPQYNGIYQFRRYYHFQSNKLRIDLKNNTTEYLDFGADVIFLLYFGEKNWNLLNFIPGRISAQVPPEMRLFYNFSYTDTLFLDNIYARISNTHFAVTVGKQQLSVGAGYFSNPTDIYNRKNVFDPTYEQTGHNGIRGDISLSRRCNLMMVLSPLDINFEESGKFVRIKSGIGRFDLSLVGGDIPMILTDYYHFLQTRQRRIIIGGDIVGEVLGFGVWAEAAYNRLESSSNFYESIVGFDYTFNSGLYFLLEYHRNSSGKTDYRAYDLNDWMRFFSGENKTLAQDQVYGYFQYPLNDLFNVGGSVIVVVSDRSGAFIPTFNYNILENVDFTFMFNLYIGEEGKAYGSNLGPGFLLRGRIYF